MAQTTLQTVEGGSILSKLADLFFKSLNKALSSDSEYEEEKGVLKQVNRFTLETLDGTDTYTLTLKLSPVKDKENYYFIEAETDAPDLDLSIINEKTVKLDDTNVAKFRKLIEKLVSSSNYVVQSKNQRNDESDEPEEDKNEMSPFEKLIEAAQKWFNQKAIIARTSDGKVVEIVPEFNKDVSEDNCQLIISAVDQNGSDVEFIELDDSEINPKDSSGALLDEGNFLDLIDKKINEFAKLNDYTGMQRMIKNSTVIAATFIKDKEGIGLVNLKASDNIDRTMEVIYEVMDSSDLINSLNEGEESSFTIEELDDSYDIQPVDNVECSQCYLDAYKVISKFYITLKALEAMIGVKIWQNDNFFSDITSAAVKLQTLFSIWANENTDVLPLLQDPFCLVPSFDKFRDYEDNSDIPAVKQSIAEEAVKMKEICNFLSVGFTPEQQSETEELISEIEGILG